MHRYYVSGYCTDTLRLLCSLTSRGHSMQRWPGDSTHLDSRRTFFDWAPRVACNERRYCSLLMLTTDEASVQRVGMPYHQGTRVSPLPRIVNCTNAADAPQLSSKKTPSNIVGRRRYTLMEVTMILQARHLQIPLAIFNREKEK
jgi:hypothetical protein